jgi:hypothetical protein
MKNGLAFARYNDERQPAGLPLTARANGSSVKGVQSETHLHTPPHRQLIATLRLQLAAVAVRYLAGLLAAEQSFWVADAPAMRRGSRSREQCVLSSMA